MIDPLNDPRIEPGDWWQVPLLYSGWWLSSALAMWAGLNAASLLLWFLAFIAAIIMAWELHPLYAQEIEQEKRRRSARAHLIRLKERELAQWLKDNSRDS